MRVCTVSKSHRWKLELEISSGAKFSISQFCLANKNARRLRMLSNGMKLRTLDLVTRLHTELDY